MTNRMTAQRKRYDNAEFIRTESIIPEHRLSELRMLTAKWRAEVREKMPRDNIDLRPGERVRYAATGPRIVSKDVSLVRGHMGTIVSKQGRLLQIVLKGTDGLLVRTGPCDWERIPHD